MIYPKLKLVFVHIPKTAGTFIESILNRYDIPLDNVHVHSTIEQIKNIINNRINDDFKNYTCFTIIREPISRHISLYNYTKKHDTSINGWSSKWGETLKENIEIMSSSDLKTLKYYKIYQSDYIILNNNQYMNNIFNYNNLDKVLRWIYNYCKSNFDINITYDIKNKINTQKLKYTIDSLSPLDINKLNKLLKNDILFYNNFINCLHEKNY